MSIKELRFYESAENHMSVSLDEPRAGMVTAELKRLRDNGSTDTSSLTMSKEQARALALFIYAWLEGR